VYKVVREDGETEMVASQTVTAGLSPQHKSAVVLFLERVYGVQDQITFYRLLENGFLPDLRAATTLEEVSRDQSADTAGLRHVRLLIMVRK